MPINVKPVKNGNIQLTEMGGVLYAKVVGAGQGTHTSHFSNCPNANQHRKEKPGKKGKR